MINKHQPVNTLVQARSGSVRFGSVRRAVSMLPFHNIGLFSTPNRFGSVLFGSARLAVWMTPKASGQAKPSQAKVLTGGAETCAKRKSTSPSLLAISAFDRIAGHSNRQLNCNRELCLRWRFWSQAEGLDWSCQRLGPRLPWTANGRDKLWLVGWLSGFRAQTGPVAYCSYVTFVRRLGEAAAPVVGECGPCPDFASNTLAFARHVMYLMRTRQRTRRDKSDTTKATLSPHDKSDAERTKWIRLSA